MGIALGLLLGFGLVLTASPWLWPRTGQREVAARAVRGIPSLLISAGLGHVPVPLFYLASAISAVAIAALAHALTQIVALALVAGAAAASAPYFALTARVRQRRKAARAVWPDVVDLVLSAVRGGLGLPEALAALAETGPQSLRHEFARFDRDYAASADFNTSLDRLKERLADPASDRILETLRMARQVGGTQLGAVLRSLSAHAREEANVRHEVEARQSWVVGAARVGVIAPWVVLVLLSSRPEAASAYNSTGGTIAIAVGLVVTLVAYRIMLTVGRLPEDKRWFA